jgi:hypothetical protein
MANHRLEILNRDTGGAVVRIALPFQIERTS